MIKITETYSDWYCEKLFSSYINRTISLLELLNKLDYEQVVQQRELFNFLNFILTNQIPHKCYNKKCKEKIFFSNTYNYVKKKEDLTLKEFIKIWIAPYNLKTFSQWNVSIPFYCCKCFKKQNLKKW